jgi:heme-degrading monooxygenase HmoA
VTAKVRVLVWYRAGEHEQISQVYRQVSAELAGTAGLVGSELLRSADDPHSYAVLSEWQDLEALRRWERGAGHGQAAAPLRRFSDRTRPGGGFGIYLVC